MALSYFFTPQLESKGAKIILDEDTSKHITQVLRMKLDDRLLLTDGKGNKATAVISDDHRKKTEVEIIELVHEEENHPKIAVGISLVKNSSRFEWFLEKATELGVNEIFPLVCERTEKEKFRLDRMQAIVISAMLQSQQTWMPLLHEPINFSDLIKTNQASDRFIAHCLPEQKKQLSLFIHKGSFTLANSLIILIGPEGDFTQAEISLALSNNYKAVALGNTRLRTETAGLIAASYLCAIRDQIEL